jgi:hypothetical protein
MRPVRFVCLFVIVGSAMALAQSKPVPLTNRPLGLTAAAPGVAFSTSPQSHSEPLGNNRPQLGSLPPPVQRLMPPDLNLNSFRRSQLLNVLP